MEFFFPAKGVYPLNYMADQSCRSRNFNLTNFQHFQRFHVGRVESNPKYVLVPVVPRRPCYGSKK